jgi:hypothetical protein
VNTSANFPKGMQRKTKKKKKLTINKAEGKNYIGGY